MNYLQYIRSDAWKTKAAVAKQRAGHKCQVCNSSLKLDAHHRTYERLGEEWPQDITVLCRACHETFELRGPTAEEANLWNLREQWLNEVGLASAA